MELTNSKTADQKADKYIIRFDQPGQRDRLKQQATQDKRSLNKHILVLIEAGERAIYRSAGEKA